MKRKERGRERIENKDRKGRGKRHKKEKKKIGQNAVDEI
jgi:hypothetical protein